MKRRFKMCIIGFASSVIFLITLASGSIRESNRPDWGSSSTLRKVFPSKTDVDKKNIPAEDAVLQESTNNIVKRSTPLLKKSISSSKSHSRNDELSSNKRTQVQALNNQLLKKTKQLNEFLSANKSSISDHPVVLSEKGNNLNTLFEDEDPGSMSNRRGISRSRKLLENDGNFQRLDQVHQSLINQRQNSRINRLKIRNRFRKDNPSFSGNQVNFSTNLKSSLEKQSTANFLPELNSHKVTLIPEIITFKVKSNNAVLSKNRTLTTSPKLKIGETYKDFSHQNILWTKALSTGMPDYGQSNIHNQTHNRHFSFHSSENNSKHGKEVPVKQHVDPGNRKGVDSEIFSNTSKLMYFNSENYETNQRASRKILSYDPFLKSIDSVKRDKDSKVKGMSVKNLSNTIFYKGKGYLNHLRDIFFNTEFRKKGLDRHSKNRSNSKKVSYDPALKYMGLGKRNPNGHNQKIPSHNQLQKFIVKKSKKRTITQKEHSQKKSNLLFVTLKPNTSNKTQALTKLTNYYEIHENPNKTETTSNSSYDIQYIKRAEKQISKQTPSKNNIFNSQASQNSYIDRFANQDVSQKGRIEKEDEFIHSRIEKRNALPQIKHDPIDTYIGLFKHNSEHNQLIIVDKKNSRFLKNEHLKHASSEHLNSVKNNGLTRTPIKRADYRAQRSKVYDPALKYMGLGKRKNQNINSKRPKTHFESLGKRKNKELNSTSFDTFPYYLGLSKHDEKNQHIPKFSINHDEFLKAHTNLFSSFSHYKSKHTKTRKLQKGIRRQRSDFDPALQYMGLGKRNVDPNRSPHTSKYKTIQKAFDVGILHDKHINSKGISWPKYGKLFKRELREPSHNSDYDPAFKYMGLGKKNEGNQLLSKYKFFESHNKLSSPSSKYIEIKKQDQSQKNEASHYDPALLYMGLGKKKFENRQGYPSLAETYPTNSNGDDVHSKGTIVILWPKCGKTFRQKLSQSSQSVYYPESKYVGLRKRIAKPKFSKEFLQDKLNKSPDILLNTFLGYKTPSKGAAIKKRRNSLRSQESGYDPALLYMGLGKRNVPSSQSAANKALQKKKYLSKLDNLRLVSRCNISMTLPKYYKFVKQSDQVSGYDAIPNYMGIGKRDNTKQNSNYDPALMHMGLGKKKDKILSLKNAHRGSLPNIEKKTHKLENILFSYKLSPLYKEENTRIRRSTERRSFLPSSRSSQLEDETKVKDERSLNKSKSDSTFLNRGTMDEEKQGSKTIYYDPAIWHWGSETGYTALGNVSRFPHEESFPNIRLSDYNFPKMYTVPEKVQDHEVQRRLANVFPLKYTKFEQRYYSTRPFFLKPQPGSVGQQGYAKLKSDQNNYDPHKEINGFNPQGNGQRSFKPNFSELEKRRNYARSNRQINHYDPSLRYMGLGKRENYHRYLRLNNYVPPLRFMGLGKKEHKVKMSKFNNQNQARRYIGGDSKRGSSQQKASFRNFNPALKLIGLGKRENHPRMSPSSNYDPSLRFMGLGKRKEKFLNAKDTEVKKPTENLTRILNGTEVTNSAFKNSLLLSFLNHIKSNLFLPKEIENWNPNLNYIIQFHPKLSNDSKEINFIQLNITHGLSNAVHKSDADLISQKEPLDYERTLPFNTDVEKRGNQRFPSKIQSSKFKFKAGDELKNSNQNQYQPFQDILMAKSITDRITVNKVSPFNPLFQRNGLGQGGGFNQGKGIPKHHVLVQGFNINKGIQNTGRKLLMKRKLDSSLDSADQTVQALTENRRTNKMELEKAINFANSFKPVQSSKLKLSSREKRSLSSDSDLNSYLKIRSEQNQVEDQVLNQGMGKRERNVGNIMSAPIKGFIQKFNPGWEVMGLDKKPQNDQNPDADLEEIILESFPFNSQTTNFMSVLQKLISHLQKMENHLKFNDYKPSLGLETSRKHNYGGFVEVKNLESSTSKIYKGQEFNAELKHNNSKVKNNQVLNFMGVSNVPKGNNDYIVTPKFDLNFNLKPNVVAMSKANFSHNSQAQNKQRSNSFPDSNSLIIWNLFETKFSPPFKTTERPMINFNQQTKPVIVTTFSDDPTGTVINWKPAFSISS